MAKGFKHGGGGGTGGTLTIIAPAGSTVTISKDDKSYSKKVAADGIVIFRGLDGGTWNVFATDGSRTEEQTVPLVVDYSAAIDYQYVIFDGASEAEYTGGWSSAVSGGVLSVVNGASSGYINGKSLYSSELIILSGEYTTMHVVVDTYNDAGIVGISTNTNSGSYDKSVPIISDGEYTIDVSDITGKYYVKMNSTGKQTSGNGYEYIGFKVSKIWLE